MQELFETGREYIFKKIVPISSALLNRASIYLCIDFQLTYISFDRNKRDTEIFHSF